MRFVGTLKMNAGGSATLHVTEGGVLTVDAAALLEHLICNVPAPVGGQWAFEDRCEIEAEQTGNTLTHVSRITLIREGVQFTVFPFPGME